MNDAHVRKIARELGFTENQVQTTAALLAEGGTIPFIARYRKEATGSLDEVGIGAIRDRLEQLAELDTRREAILTSMTERELLTDELRAKIVAAETLPVLEDIYLPFRPKRRTRATIARERGLEPLALALLEQKNGWEPLTEAAKFVDAEKEVPTADDALAGARDIVAETVNEDANVRAKLRTLFARKGQIISKITADDKQTAGAKFRDYFDWKEAVSSAPSHRVLAMFRGEHEEFLRLAIEAPENEAIAEIEALHVKGRNAAAEQVRLAIADGYRRLLAPSMETEVRADLKKKADAEAIRVFVENLRELLLAAPLGQKRVLAIDPGYRTGCKIALLDEQGKLLFDSVIYPTTDQRGKIEEAKEFIQGVVDRFQVEAVAIGNGTAGRETESFIRALGLKAIVVMVDESGASIYSASEVAREEFPDKDITVRGAVSIGRRLMDPLAELVKIDPRSIGVGQYQHDVDQTALRRSLDDTVMSAVNKVGVEANTASKELLTYVSGLGPALAKNIVDYRNENGAFESRAQLRKVKRLGPKAFEQCAGFLRIRDGKNPLDASAVHPESYPIVEKMAKDLGCKVKDLMQKPELREAIKLEDYVTDKVGLPTLHDIMQELAKPGRDPRQQFEAFSFADNVHDLKDLQVGMKLPGIVTNVTMFGAFVDVGVHCDGLVHVSQLSDNFVKDPSEVVKVHQRVNVTVMEVDLERKRVGLSMKSHPFEQKAPAEEKPKREEHAPRPGGPRRDQPHGGDQRPPRRDGSGPKPGGNAPRPAGGQSAPPPRREEKPAAPKAPVNNWFAEAFKQAKKK